MCSSPFIVGQVVGLSAAGFFAFGTLYASPLSVVAAMNQSQLSISDRSKLLISALHTNGRRAFLGSVLVGSTGFMVAYLSRPSKISVFHSRVLLGAAFTLLLAVPHTVLLVLPVYKKLAAESEAKAEDKEAEKRWEVALKQFYFENGLRTALFGGVYAVGLWSLINSKRGGRMGRW